MHLYGHTATAIPFVIAGNYIAAIGCVLPDITWIPNEVAFRRSKFDKWSDWILTVPSSDILPYRVAHSVLFWVPMWLLGLTSLDLLFGVAVHIVCDLFTHRGRMQQQPFYPIQWRWPWIITKQ